MTSSALAGAAHDGLAARFASECLFRFANARRSAFAELLAGVGDFVALRGDPTAVASGITFYCGSHTRKLTDE